MTEYIQVPGPKGDFGICDMCTKKLAIADGYLAIPPEWLELPENKKEKDAALDLAESQGRAIYDMTGPSIICEDCARKYKPSLNMKMTKEDLDLWRKTGAVPLRPNAGPKAKSKWWPFSKRNQV